GINSCTVKKRLYQPGYYVEWNKKNKELKHQTVKAEIKSNEEEGSNEAVAEDQNCNIGDTYLLENTPNDEMVYASNDLSNNNLEIVKSKSQNHTLHISSEKLLSGFYKSAIGEKSFKSKDVVDKTKDLDWTAIAGPSASAFYWVLYLITFVFRFPVPFILWLVALSGLVISIIALVKIIKYPETYRGKLYAILGIALNPIVLGILGITVAIIINMYL
ncbi:MAG: hypothetical protein PHH30_10025, partial [Bacteroidales bacterium]|nr:hypothetical protein [Bacteroidales bacterium]